MPGAAADPTAAVVDECLDDRVLAGMESDRRQPAARSHQALRSLKAPAQLGQLVVDRDAKGLKGSGRRIGLVARRGFHACHQRCQLPRGSNRRVLPLRNNRARYPACVALVAITPKKSRQIIFADAGEKVSRRRSAAVHAHVQIGIVAKREASLSLIDLKGRNAKVEDDCIDPLQRLLLHDPLKVAEARLDKGQPWIGRGILLAAGNGVRVPIKGNHPLHAAGQDRTSVPAPAKRRIDHHLPGPPLQCPHHLGKQHRFMAALDQGGREGKNDVVRDHESHVLERWQQDYQCQG